MDRIACLHFPNWSIQRLVVSQPEMRFRRIMLFVQHPQRGQIVAAISPLAWRSGVRPGMPVSEGKSLLRKSADSQFVVLPYEPRVDQEALVELARSLDRFSPVIGLDHQLVSDSLLLDLTGLAYLFDGEAGWRQQLEGFLELLGYVTQVAVASTVGAAWGLAHFACPNLNAVVQGCEAGELDQLPPEALRLDAGVCQTLRQLGLDTIGALRQIPAASLATRFGDTINRRLSQLSGEQPETFRSVPRSVFYHAEQLLEFPIRDQDTVLVVIERLLERVCAELRSIRQGALAWQIRLWRSEASPLYLRVGLFQASARTDQVIPLVKMQLEQHPEFDGWSYPVEEVKVEAAGCVLLVERQGNLFDDQPCTNDAALGELLNRLAIRMGEDNVVSAVKVSGVQPERSVEYRPWVGPRSVRPRASHRWSSMGVLDRPVRMFPQALEIFPSDDQSELPLLFQFSGTRPLKVNRWWGPERMETGWWNGRMVRRDYWRIETAEGAQIWIYQDLRSRRWYLQGAF